MSNDLERLIESNAKAIQVLAEESRQTKQLIESNARAIQSYADESQRQIARLGEAMAHMTGAMARMAAAQSHFWQIQEDYYRKLSDLDAQQRRTIQILNRLEEKLGKDED